jgi:pSer/pThr/pTyr-binding forkhead associated (FHA) protein
MPQPTEPFWNPPERQGTVIETDEDLRQALLSGSTGRQAVPVPVPVPAAKPQPSARAGIPFRPTLRPGVPILTVCDDGKPEGEVIRIRSPRFVIGRTDGDLCIPIDGRMSARHVEITHQVIGGRHRWVVTDLQSTHGLFVRVSKTALSDGAEILVGNGRYRFEAMQNDAGATGQFVPGDSAGGQTRGWDDQAPAFRPAALTELVGSEIGNRLILAKPEYWIGSDPSCAVCRTDDPFCDPKHVRISRNSKGGWNAEHDRTLNGLWLRMSQITVDGVLHFQIGEQRFKLKVS